MIIIITYEKKYVKQFQLDFTFRHFDEFRLKKIDKLAYIYMINISKEKKNLSKIVGELCYMEVRKPVEMLDCISDSGVIRVQRNMLSLVILSLLAGIFIAFAAQGSTMAAHNLLANPGTSGLARILVGAIFTTGLMLVIFTGAEMFTGNSMIVTAVLDRRVTVKQMLFNWLVVYVGNFIGGVFIAWMIAESGQFNASEGLLGGVTIQIAASKVAIPFHRAFILGIMCNWLVCLAILSSFASRGPEGKVLIIFFVISLFVISAFEHSVANMYYISAGIFAKQNPQWVAMSNISAEQLAALNWGNFLVRNLIPVTLGNIVGGGFMVWTLFWLALRKKKEN